MLGLSPMSPVGCLPGKLKISTEHCVVLEELCGAPVYLLPKLIYEIVDCATAGGMWKLQTAFKVKVLKSNSLNADD